MAAVLFGLAPVQHEMANLLSEIAVGYPNSPLNSSIGLEHAGPAPGHRAPVRHDDEPIGEGDTPRFALFAVGNNALASVTQEFADLLEPAMRAPYAPGGAWLVRPDGYVALRVKSNDAHAIRNYLHTLRSFGHSIPDSRLTSVAAPQIRTNNNSPDLSSPGSGKHPFRRTLRMH